MSVDLTLDYVGYNYINATIDKWIDVSAWKENLRHDFVLSDLFDLLYLFILPRERLERVNIYKKKHFFPFGNSEFISMQRCWY